MVSDEELNAHVSRVERNEQFGRTERDDHVEREPPAGEPDLDCRVDELEATARCVHNELARRIEQVDATDTTDEAFADLADRIETIEDRLDAIDERLD